MQDVRYGVRQLIKDPVFTLVAAASLALGIGANTAIFQLVNAIRLKSLPVRNPQELVTVDFAKNSSRSGWWSSRSARMTYSQYDQIRQNQQGFAGVIAWSATRFNLAHGGEPRFVEGLYVNGDFFEQLGVNASFGRTFTPQDDDVSKCSAGAGLHGRMAIMRGVESGFSIAQSAKQGVLTVSDDRGRIQAEKATNAAGWTLLADVPMRHDATLYARWGDWFSWLNLAALIALLFTGRATSADRSGNGPRESRL